MNGPSSHGQTVAWRYIASRSPGPPVYRPRYAQAGLHNGFVMSTLGRELQALASHAVHHFALIGFVLRLVYRNLRPAECAIDAEPGPHAVGLDRRRMRSRPRVVLVPARISQSGVLLIERNGHRRRPGEPRTARRGIGNRVEQAAGTTRWVRDTIEFTEMPTRRACTGRTRRARQIRRRRWPYVSLVLIAASTLISEDLACIGAGVLAARGRINLLTGVLGVRRRGDPGLRLPTYSLIPRWRPLSPPFPQHLPRGDQFLNRRSLRQNLPLQPAAFISLPVQVNNSQRVDAGQVLAELGHLLAGERLIELRQVGPVGHLPQSSIFAICSPWRCAMIRSGMRLNLNTVNDELARLGEKAELAKGVGYFYFRGPAADDWIDRTVSVRTINSFTLKQWIEEYRRLKALNQQIMKTLKPGAATTAPARSRKKPASSPAGGPADSHPEKTQS
jgi:hypothetical protein